MIAGLAELFSSSVPALQYTWPIAVLLTGSLFLFHSQQALRRRLQKAMRQHRLLGGTLIAAGLLNLIEIINRARFAAILWPILLIIAAVQLSLYREPEGAYEEELTHRGHGEH